MKRLLIGFILVVSVNLSKAQVAKNALGLRLGGGNGYGTEISYQHGLGNINRLEFDLGLHSGSHYQAWGLAGLYQWVWNIDQGLDWFVGAGGLIGSWNYDNSYAGSNSGGAFLAAAGDIGIEYSFPVGIQLSLDARPALNLLNNGESFNTNVGFGIRYKFK
jgi:hypothetical protein